MFRTFSDDKVHAGSRRDPLDNRRVIGFNQRDNIRPLCQNHLRKRIRPPFTAVKDVVGDQTHAKLRRVKRQAPRKSQSPMPQISQERMIIPNAIRLF